MGIPAERVTLIPTGTSQLVRMTGRRLTEKVSPDSVEHVKNRLVGSNLKQGEFVIADFSVKDGSHVVHAPVVFFISNIQPPDANQADERTIVKVVTKIEGEKPKDNQFTPSSDGSEEQEQLEKQFVRRVMEDRLEFLMGEIANCEEQHLNADTLRAEVESLERQL